MPSELPEMGKISAEVFDELIYPRLGRRRWPTQHRRGQVSERIGGSL